MRFKSQLFRGSLTLQIAEFGALAQREDPPLSQLDAVLIEARLATYSMRLSRANNWSQNTRLSRCSNPNGHGSRPLHRTEARVITAHEMRREHRPKDESAEIGRNEEAKTRRDALL